MEYQDFKSKKLNDDSERAERGGSIGWTGSTVLPPGYYEAMTDIERQRLRGGDQSPIIKSLIDAQKKPDALDVQQPEDEDTKKYKDIQDAQDRLNARRVILNAMSQGATKGIEDEDFKRQYPEFQKLKEEQDLDVEKIAFDPLNDEYIQMQEAKELQDAINSLNKSREPGKFLKIGDIIKPQWTK